MGAESECKKATRQCDGAVDKIKAAVQKQLDQVTGNRSKNLGSVSNALNDPNSLYTYWSTADENNFLRNYYKTEKDKLYSAAKNDSVYLSKSVDLNRKGDLKAIKYSIFGNPDNCTKTECPTQQGKDSIENKLSKYTENLARNFSGSAEDIKRNAEVQHENYMRELMALVVQYKSQESYSKRMQELLNTKKKERSELENERVKKNVDGRKAVYEMAEKNKLKSTRKIMFYIYYITFVVYMIFGNFIKDEKYRSVKVWIIIILYLSLPLYLNYIISGLIQLYDKFLYIKDNKMPKNVYTDLSDN